MRLDFRNIGKGLEAIAGAKKARDLAQESARYDVTEGAYGQGLQTNIDQLRAVQEQNPEQAAEYEPAIAELTRRQGLTAPDYSIASGAQDYGTRQEARQAAAPLRAEGLAGVYRRYGDVAQADTLEARAFEQQRAMAAEERAKAAEARAQQDFANRSTLTGLEINDRTRTAATAKRMDDFNAWRSQNPDADFGAINAEVKRLGMGVDEQFKVASSLTGIGEQEFKASQQRIRKLVENQGLDGLLKAHKESNDLDPGSHFEVIRGKGGAVSLNRVDTATGKVIQPNVFSGNEAETTAYLNKAAMDPATIIDFTMNLEKNRAAIAAQQSQTRVNEATIGLRGVQMRQISNQEAASAEAQQIRAQFMALSDEDQAGPRGLALRQAFTMANAKAGAVVPLGAPPRAATGPARELSDLDKENLREYREWVKDPRNAKLPQGQKDAYAAQLGVTEFVNRAAAGPASGFGSNPYATPQPGAAPAASQPAQISLDAPVRPAGLVTPAQAAAAQTTQTRQTAAQAQQATEAGIRTQGVARQNYILQQEAASLTPAVIRQLTPTQATEAIRLYGQFLTPEQRREVNRRM